MICALSGTPLSTIFVAVNYRFYENVASLFAAVILEKLFNLQMLALRTNGLRQKFAIGISDALKMSTKFLDLHGNTIAAHGLEGTDHSLRVQNLSIGGISVCRCNIQSEGIAPRAGVLNGTKVGLGDFECVCKHRGMTGKRRNIRFSVPGNFIDDERKFTWRIDF